MMRVLFRVKETDSQPSCPKVAVVVGKDLTHVMVLPIEYCMDSTSILLSIELLNQTMKPCEMEGRIILFLMLFPNESQLTFS